MPGSAIDEAVIVREDHRPYLDLYKRSDGIFKIITADNLNLTAKEAKVVSDAVLEFAGRVPHVLLVVTGQHAQFEKEFIYSISSKEILSYTTAIAFVVKGVTERNIAGSLLATHGSAKPIMLFENENEAIIWLRDQFRRSAVALPGESVADALSGDGVTITTEIRHPLSLFAVYKRSDNIVVIVCRDYLWLTVKEINALIAMVKEITGGVPHRILVIVGRKTSIDKEARSYSVTAEADQYALATAVVIKSWPQRVIGNLMITVDQPKKPLKSFDSIKEAIAWLKVQN